MRFLTLALLAAIAHNLGRVADGIEALRWQLGRPERRTVPVRLPGHDTNPWTYRESPRVPATTVTWVGANGERHTYGDPGDGAR